MKNLLLLFTICIIGGCHDNSTQPVLLPDSSTHQLKYEWHFDRAQNKSVIYTGANGSNVYLSPTKYGIEGLTGSSTISATKPGRYNLVVEGSRDETPGVVVYVRATISVDGVKTVERIAGGPTHAVASIGVDMN